MVVNPTENRRRNLTSDGKKGPKIKDALRPIVLVLSVFPVPGVDYKLCLIHQFSIFLNNSTRKYDRYDHR